ncbi:uncharacterized protein [Aegilops tauschii subsp. strangulata]|uniref:uncharacterized protein n=1 Tax=Aegilops tauschii subsp. strangulata TaxID=200361 RepID=UPI001ABCE49F|nr:uncharacterized protein LOC120963391 [Aegilops tauschii subsp. strangulata]
MTKLGLEAKDLEPSRTVFHCIVPGLSYSPIGRIWLDVVDLSSAYHALLGRPALTKFMAIPHYAYLKMKLSGPKILITFVGDYSKSLECAQAGVRLAESLVIAEERRQLDRIVALANETPVVPVLANEPASRASFQPSRETRKVKLNPEDHSCSE